MYYFSCIQERIPGNAGKQPATAQGCHKQQVKPGIISPVFSFIVAIDEIERKSIINQ
jgi:hypothetical protein